VLGAGPGVFLYDSSELPNRKLLAFVRGVAKDIGVPLQLDVVQGYGDDSAEMRRSRGCARSSQHRDDRPRFESDLGSLGRRTHQD